MVTIDNIDSFVCVSASTNEDFLESIIKIHKVSNKKYILVNIVKCFCMENHRTPLHFYITNKNDGITTKDIVEQMIQMGYEVCNQHNTIYGILHDDNFVIITLQIK